MKSKHNKYWTMLCSVAAVALFAGKSYAANITVDYTKTLQPVNARAFGVDVTGYGQDLTTDANMRQVMTNLKLGQLRMYLVWKNGVNSSLVCGGAGCNAGGSGDAWVTQIKATGAQPIVEVDGNL